MGFALLMKWIINKPINWLLRHGCSQIVPGGLDPCVHGILA